MEVEAKGWASKSHLALDRGSMDDTRCCRVLGGAEDLKAHQ